MPEQMEQKLNDLLNNPEMMRKIASLAQSLQQSENTKTEHKPMQQPDMAMIQTIANFASQRGIDSNQQALIKALSPYISRQRIMKLENAMQAAKMARLAISLLGNDSTKQFAGR